MTLMHNVGGADRTLRIVFGIVLLLLAIFAGWNPVLRALMGLIGAIGVVTGLLRYCPVNQMLNIDTAREHAQGL